MWSPCREFSKRLRGSRLKGEHRVIQCGADRYRKNEAIQALDSAALNWPVTWRGTGASATADGSFDVRSFQDLVYQGTIKTAPSLVMRSAITESEITRKDGNPKLNKSQAPQSH